MIFHAIDLTVYSLADEERVEIVGLPPDGTMADRCNRAAKICLTRKEALGLAKTLRDAAKRL